LHGNNPQHNPTGNAFADSKRRIAAKQQHHVGQEAFNILNAQFTAACWLP